MTAMVNTLAVYINNAPMRGSLIVDQNVESMWSTGPRQDPRWQYVDRAGHFHARSEYEADRYPTLLEIVAPVECDGSCSGACEDEGYHVTHYYCRICQEEIRPGLIEGPHRFSVPGVKSWTAEVIGRIPVCGEVSVRIEADNQVHFGVARCVASSGGRMDPNDDIMEFRSTLLGIGPLGRRKATSGDTTPRTQTITSP